MAAGTTYKIDSRWMDLESEAVAFGSRTVQVAYATTAPANAIFKSEFDQRHPHENALSALVAAAGMGLLVAFIGTLALVGPALWLRRARFDVIRSK